MQEHTKEEDQSQQPMLPTKTGSPTKPRSDSTATLMTVHSSTMTMKQYAVRHARFLFLVMGMMVFFGCHNYLQELIMSLPGNTNQTYSCLCVMVLDSLLIDPDYKAAQP